jgi:DNA-binding phage protein
MANKKTEEDLESPASQEVRQLMDLLHTLARAMGFSNASLARQANVSLASLVRYFKGDAEPRLDFVLAVVRAIGLDVREFFEIAYPARATPTEARRRIESLLGPIRREQLFERQRAPGSPPLTSEDFERSMGDLRREVRELADRYAREHPDAGAPGPPKPRE